MAETCLIDPRLLLYLILGAIVGMIYSLRRIFLLEKVILRMEEKIDEHILSKGSFSTMLSPVKPLISKVAKKVTKKKKVVRKKRR